MGRYHRYTDEEKLKILRRRKDAIATGAVALDIARAIGIHNRTILGWIKEFKKKNIPLDYVTPRDTQTPIKQLGVCDEAYI